MAKKKKKRRSLIGMLLDALLSVIDWVCETIAGFIVALLRGLGLAIWWILRGAAFVLLAIGRALCAVPVWIVRRLTAKRNRAYHCLRLDGPEFEAYVALVLRDNGFKRVELTKGSGDQGADILAERNGKRYAIQYKGS